MVTLVKDDSFYSVELDRMVSGKSWTLDGHRIDWDSDSGVLAIDGLTWLDGLFDLYRVAELVSEYVNSLLG